VLSRRAIATRRKTRVFEGAGRATNRRSPGLGNTDGSARCLGFKQEERWRPRVPDLREDGRAQIAMFAEPSPPRHRLLWPIERPESPATPSLARTFDHDRSPGLTASAAFWMPALTRSREDLSLKLRDASDALPRGASYVWFLHLARPQVTQRRSPRPAAAERRVGAEADGG
jgi:hypothetical protein